MLDEFRSRNCQCVNSATSQPVGTPLTSFTFSWPGKRKTDEPFAVDFLGHLFQQRDAPLVVFNQLIIRRENRGNLSLDMKLWNKRSVIRRRIPWFRVVWHARRQCIRPGFASGHLCPRYRSSRTDNGSRPVAVEAKAQQSGLRTQPSPVLDRLWARWPFVATVPFLRENDVTGLTHAAFERDSPMCSDTMTSATKSKLYRACHAERSARPDHGNIRESVTERTRWL